MTDEPSVADVIGRLRQHASDLSDFYNGRRRMDPTSDTQVIVREAADALARETARAERLQQEQMQLCDTCRNLQASFRPDARYDPGNGCVNCTNQNHLAILEAQLTALTAQQRQLREAVEGVLNAYGDKGWAKSEMCRRLRAALAVSERPAQEGT